MTATLPRSFAIERFLRSFGTACRGSGAQARFAPETIDSVDSDRAHAAVDEQFAAGNEAAVVTREEQHRSRDLFGPSHAAERDIRGMFCANGSSLFWRTGLGVDQRPVARSRRDRVDPDATLLELHRPGPGIGAHRRLGGRIGTPTGEAPQGGD